jgi:hypothetical protein
MGTNADSISQYPLSVRGESESKRIMRAAQKEAVIKNASIVSVINLLWALGKEKSCLRNLFTKITLIGGKQKIRKHEP